ncbi:MAG TPA: bacillithiol transferase BstA [Terriglobia bacterium]|nr:bacillithiol transferase BstA [Terriglobia bacterium]
MTDLRYPVGRFQAVKRITETKRQALIEGIEQAPAKLSAAVHGLTAAQLDTPYRPDGWTVRQVVHHLPDSHLNAYVRFKLALTEDAPAIRTYEQQLWAELEDARVGPVEISLALLQALHQRWVLLLRVLQRKDFARTFRHPELGVVTLDQQLQHYEWHGRHHIAHITSLRERRGW